MGASKKKKIKNRKNTKHIFILEIKESWYPPSGMTIHKQKNELRIFKKVTKRKSEAFQFQKTPKMGIAIRLILNKNLLFVLRL